MRTAKRREQGRSFWKRLVPDFSSTQDAPIDKRSLYALSTLLLLVQLPHMLHLPRWVSLLGALLVAGRLLLIRYNTSSALKRVLSPVSVTSIAILSAFAIHWDFGYFVGRDPGVAFLFVLVAAKFAEVRRSSDATLLLCLSAFLLLTQYFYSQSILAAVVTLPGVVALAYTLSVLRDPQNPASTFAQLKLVATLLIQGLPLAALLFIVFPRLPGPLWSLPEDAMATTGLSDSMSPGSIGQVSRSDAVAFRAEFDGEPPPNNQRYWRGPVLTEFDGREWRVGDQLAEAAQNDYGSMSNLTSYTVMLQPHRQRWLFALDAPVGKPFTDTASQANGIQQHSEIARLYNDGQIKSDQPINTVLRYQQNSIMSSITTPSGPPSESTLILPGKNRRTIEFAQSLHAKTSSNPDYARSVMYLFNQQGYTYTLQPQLLGDAPVDEFLFDTKAGFCEHYAAAFVVMMRAAGIPARVVTGYLGGEMNKGYMIVRQSDAHAWAEAFINGQWHRFDPTGVVAPSRIADNLAVALPAEASARGLARLDYTWMHQAQLRWDALNHQWQRLIVGFDDDSQSEFWNWLGINRPPLWQIAVLIVLIAGAWSLVILTMPRLSENRLASQERLWNRYCRLLRTRGLARSNTATQSEYLQVTISRWPNQRARLERLHNCFISVRFKAPAPESGSLELRQIRRDLFMLWWTLLPGKSRHG
ncbi:MAG: DUF3488 and DUF4129 domain-containing transglutaminase family protein [Granulosicoccus sp.]